MNSKKRILSGIQPSGTLHIGNYFGAMRQYLELQDDCESFIFIANYHAMTTVKDKEILKKNTIDVALNYLAIGLDEKKVNLFRQSDIPEVCELTWILSTITPMGLLERAHSYKDKIAKGISPDHGLFAYPVLMASDILIYKSDIVPVGKDQKQHVEIARDLAIKFNGIFGDILKVPDVRIQESTAVVPGIDGQKMSKSYDNYIAMFDDEKTIKKKVMSIVTDSTPIEAPKDPNKCNIFALYKLMATPDEIKDMEAKYLKGGYGFGEAKKTLLAKILDYFADSRKRYNELKNDPGYIERVLKEGAERVRPIACQTLKEVRIAVGLE
jgi:tryptophanyl-tRNA synthetase